MGSRSIGGIYASLSLRDQNFAAGMKKAADSMNAWTVAKGVMLAHGIEAGLKLAYDATVKGVTATIEHTGALVDLSDQTGIAVDSLMLLQQAYKDGGRDADMAAKDIARMQKAITSASEAKPGDETPFSKISMDARALIQLNPAAQFEAIGNAIMRIENPAQRTAASLAIFGKGGAGLSTVFDTLESSRNVLGDMPAMAARFGRAMEQAGDLIGRFPVKSEQFFTGFTAGIIGSILPGLAQVDKYDFTNIGKSLGDNLAWGIEMVTNGDVLESLWLCFESGFIEVGNKFVNSIIDSAAYASAYIDSLFGADYQKSLAYYKDLDAKLHPDFGQGTLEANAARMAEIAAAAEERRQSNEANAEGMATPKPRVWQPDPYVPTPQAIAAPYVRGNYTADPGMTHGMYYAGADQGNLEISKQTSLLEKEVTTQLDVLTAIKEMNQHLKSLDNGPLLWTKTGTSDTVTP